MSSYNESYKGAADWHAISGGKPKADWSGLDASVPRSAPNPKQERPAKSDAKQKAYARRIVGLTVPFKEGHSLRDFREDILDHLNKNGLDTITFLPDVADRQVMRSIITEHPKFTTSLLESIKIAKNISLKYDAFDLDNSVAATEFLFASLDTELTRRVKRLMEPGDTFAAVWLRLIDVLVSISSRHHDDIREKVRRCSPTDYAHENLEAMIDDIKVSFEDLICANQFDVALLYTFLNNISEKCTQTGIFKHNLFGKMQDVSNELRQCAFMSRDNALDHMTSKSLDPESIFKFLRSEYQVLSKDNLWTPSQRRVDSSKVSASMNLLHNADPHTDMDALCKSLIGILHANGGGGKPGFVKKTPQDSPCHICGKVGHWSPTCPDKDKSSKGGKPFSKPSYSKAVVKGKVGDSNWKRIPPKHGEPQSKMVNRVEWFYCSKCDRWTKSHGTNSHGTNVNQSSDTEKGANLIIDPSVWLLSSEDVDPTSTVSSIFTTVIVAIALTMLAVYWIKVTGPLKVVPIMGLCNSSIALVTTVFKNFSTVISSKLVMGLTLDWNMVFHSSLRAMTMVPFTTLFAPIFWSAILVGIRHIPEISKWISVPNVNPTFMTTRPYVAHSGVHEGSKLLAVDAGNANSKWKIRPSRLRGNHHLRPHHRPSHEAPTVKQRKTIRQASKVIDMSTKAGIILSTNEPSRANPRHWNANKRKGKRHQSHCRYHLHSSDPFHHVPSQNLTQNQTEGLHKMLNIHLDTLDKDYGKHILSTVAIGPRTPKSGVYPVIWDSGASVCVEPDKRNFVNYTTKVDIPTLSSFTEGGKSKVIGMGFVLHSIEDENGMLRTLKLKHYHVPSSKHKIIATSEVLDRYQGETISIDSKGLTLSGVIGDPSRCAIFAPRNISSSLLVSIAHKYNSETPIDAGKPFHEVMADVNLAAVHDDNVNLSPAERELLKWHQRLAHISFAKVQHLMRSGVLANTEATRRLHRVACNLPPIKCSACVFAKQRLRSSPGTKTTAVSDRQGILKKNDLNPGQEVSVDHFVCSTKGRLFNSRGKSSEKEMFSGGAIFVDHASSHVHVEFQTVLTSHATIHAKTQYEAMCRDHGVIPQKYLSDNASAFTSQEFTNHLTDFRQLNRFAGVGAHHHNGLAERSIQTIMSISRAMLIHAAIHWPDMADTKLWPMAVQQACFIWNKMPSISTGLSPSDIFTRTRWPQSKFHDLHVWGCPVYVLDKKISDGNKIPKWKPRSHRCVNLGRAPSYASSIPLCLNTGTGSITPQFHVVFDDWFSTVASDPAQLPDFNSDEWNKLFGDSAFQYLLDPADIAAMQELTEELEQSVDSSNAEYARNRVMEASERLRPSTSVTATNWGESKIPHDRPIPQPTVDPTIRANVMPPIQPSFTEPILPVIPATASASPTPLVSSPSAPPVKISEVPPPAPIPAPAPAPAPSPPVVPAPPNRRSTRTSRPVNRWIVESATVNLAPSSHYQDLFASINCSSFNDEPASQINICLNEEEVFHSILTAKKKLDPDLFTFEEAMSDEQRDLWIAAAELEITELESHGVWTEVPLHSVKGQVVPSTWVFRVKRGPDGTIKRRKARICLRGDLMRGITDTYAPVVAFPTVRLFLIMSIILKWKTCSIDFSNAFVQAKRVDDVYMRVPRGFRTSKEGHVLKLIRSLYGAKDAPKLWFELLSKALISEGFTQSGLDACLWYRKDIFIVLFVDDCGIAAKSEGIIDQLIANLNAKNFKLTKEETFNEFLGISYDTMPNGDIHLVQKGLIKKVIAAAGFERCSHNKLPASREALGIDPDGEPMDELWSYPSIVGMLLYLSNNTRPDITFATSQVARFTHNPKKSHAAAVKMIIRYLAGTSDKGTIVKSATSLELTCHVDADFAGLYRRDPDESISSAKSRMGYVIKLSECPLIWKSQLMPTICLSTAESEYYALSQAMRALIPTRALILEMLESIDFPSHLHSLSNQLRATVHEDNTSALSLATEHRISSRTRHYHQRSHFFWQAVKDGSVEVIYCDTNSQQADYLTKGLVWEPFTTHRKSVQGW